jgi:hypothetical protein
MSKELFISGNKVVHVSTHIFSVLYCILNSLGVLKPCISMSLMKSVPEFYPLARSAYPDTEFFCISALIPLTEFSDPHVTKTYGVLPDKETIEILTQVVASHRGVRAILAFICSFQLSVVDLVSPPGFYYSVDCLSVEIT